MTLNNLHPGPLVNRLMGTSVIRGNNLPLEMIKLSQIANSKVLLTLKVL